MTSTRPPRDASRTVPGAPPSARVHWFTSAPFAAHGGPGTRRPWGTVHAREVGSPATACGTPAQTWRMFFDQPFRVVGPDVCRDCVTEVQRSGGVLRRTDRQRRRARIDLSGA